MATQTRVMARPINPASTLARMESSPRVGETLRSSSMLTGVCNGFSSTLASARFLLVHAAATDDGVAAVDGCFNHRRGLNHAIQHDREPVAHVCRSDVAEF